MKNCFDFKIGFSNYKRFKEFPLTPLKPITMLVGTNSSGKSSFIKALLFLTYNLKRAFEQRSTINKPFIDNVTFHFKTLDQLGLGDYETSKHKAFDAYGVPVIQEFDNIEFMVDIANVLITFSFGASEDEIRLNSRLNLTLPIKGLSIKDLSTGSSIKYEKTDSSYTAISSVKTIQLINWLKDKMQYLQWRIERKYSTKPDFAYLQKYRDFENSDRYENHCFHDSLELLIDKNTKIAEKLQDTLNDTLSVDLNASANEDDIFYAVKEYSLYWHQKLINALSENLISSIEPIYIEAHNASHDTALSIKDKENYLAQTVAEFFTLMPSSMQRDIDQWICKWLKEFKIGNDFEINLLNSGETLTVDVIVGSNSLDPRLSRIPLGKLGTGSIQLFILILKIATTLSKLQRENSVNNKYIIIVEEPEQNLHPALQSKLADFFYEVYNLTNGHINFIVETHSEYLIRRTQVFVAKNNYTEKTLDTENPFKVYYFPEEGIPYDMEYLTSGRFKNKFGKGFFDEASNSALIISKIERKNANI
ncbi:AAA family ATPase [uncultured Duncaniella sp.]|uniref:AAA family ATPase n=1 Tax=uncultured Duncaniella sp. TaxID=2768039 RepID=UPI002674A6EF|nr:AAA family ATPase [uncultured Duncaniella sp.]